MEDSSTHLGDLLDKIHDWYGTGTGGLNAMLVAHHLFLRIDKRHGTCRLSGKGRARGQGRGEQDKVKEDKTRRRLGQRGTIQGTISNKRRRRQRKTPSKKNTTKHKKKRETEE